MVAEPSAAAALAAVRAGRVGARPGDRVVAVVSGSNVDVADLLRMIAE